MNNIVKYLHPVIAGVFGTLATIIGSHFFNKNNHFLYIGIGITLFFLANYIMLKLKFNAYQAHGSTIATVVIFASQVITIGLWTIKQIGTKWMVGVIFIILGTYLL